MTEANVLWRRKFDEINSMISDDGWGNPLWEEHSNHYGYHHPSPHCCTWPLDKFTSILYHIRNHYRDWCGPSIMTDITRSIYSRRFKHYDQHRSQLNDPREHSWIFLFPLEINDSFQHLKTAALHGISVTRKVQHGHLSPSELSNAKYRTHFELIFTHSEVSCGFIP